MAEVRHDIGLVLHMTGDNAGYQRSLDLRKSIRASGKLGSDAREPEIVASALARRDAALKERLGLRKRRDDEAGLSRPLARPLLT